MDKEFTLNIRERPIFSISSCAVCWKSSQIFCSECKLIGYCSKPHLLSHQHLHGQFCEVIKKVAAPKRFLYENIGKVSSDEWRQIRISKLQQVQVLLDRALQMNEREMLLFPQICSCFETNLDNLKVCSKCEQVWFCKNNYKHLLKSHSSWCDSLKLLTSLARRALNFSIEIKIETHVCASSHFQPQEMSQALKHCLLTSKKKRTDENCEKAIISTIASGPLTALYAATVSKIAIPSGGTLCVHLVGAEPHFELNAIDAWEMFFLHLLPSLNHLKVVMVGPELNPGGQVPLELFKSRTMCTFCQVHSRKIEFEFVNGLYHDFADSEEYEKVIPDLICAFNPGLHRTTGFQMHDTWPLTIKKILNSKTRVPFVSTAYTSYEAPRDLDRIRQIVGDSNFEILHEPSVNPFSSLRPDRNFISDDEAPLIFKNFYLFIVKGK